MDKNKIMNFFKNYYYIFLPVFITMLAVLIFKPWYDLDGDDLVLANMVHSAPHNPKSEYLVFIHYILGYLMRLMALAFPKLNVYAITLLISMSFAFGVFFYNTKKYDNKKFSVLIISLLQFFMIFGVTFTVVAFLCSAASILLIVDNVKQLNRKSIKYFILSFVLIFLGLSLRRGSLAIAVFLLFVPVCFYAVKHKRITISVALVMVIAFIGVSEFLKISQESYKEKLFEGTDFVEFHKYRGIATDSGDLDYSYHKELFDSSGISENDIKLCGWFFYNDKTIMPTKKIKVISESFSVDDKYTLNPIEIAKGFLRNFDSFLFILLFVIIAIIVFLFGKQCRKETLFCFVFVMGAVLYLNIRKRSVTRVVKPIVFIGYMQMLNIYLRNKIDVLKEKKVKTRVLAGIVALIYLTGLGFCMIPERQTNKDLESCVQYIKADSAYKYASFEAVKTENVVTFLRVKPRLENIISNVYTGWMVYSPYWYSLLEKYGINEYKDSIYLSLADEKVKIVSGSGEKIESFVVALKEHYNKQFEIKKEKVFGKYFICTLEEITE